MNSNFPNRWSPASLTFNNYFYFKWINTANVIIKIKKYRWNTNSIQKEELVFKYQKADDKIYVCKFLINVWEIQRGVEI